MQGTDKIMAGCNKAIVDTSSHCLIYWPHMAIGAIAMKFVKEFRETQFPKYFTKFTIIYSSIITIFTIVYKLK